jgi:glycosyltransferase involved in cell wall biosynthesis
MPAMTNTLAGPPTVDVEADDEPAAPLVDIVVPVLNEIEALERSVHRLRAHLMRGFPFTWRITITDNGSTDGTGDLADRLARDLPGVSTMHLAERGRGRALRTAWSASPSPILAYTDVDLSSGLDGLLPLVAPLVTGHSDIAVGSRLVPGATVQRGLKREVTSRGYNLILRAAFRVPFHDAQCGFKALRADVAQRLLPVIEDEGWFFDTELLLLADRNGLRVHEVPVDWIDDPDSRVDIVQTALDDLRGVRRMWWTFRRGGGQVDLGTANRRVGASLGMR